MRLHAAPATIGMLLTLLVAPEGTGPSARTTFFVAPNGSNANPGTETRPFKTIARGLNALLPGKTLYIKAGSYAESLGNNVPAGRSWASPVTVAAFRRDTVILLPPGGAHVFHPAGSASCYIILRGLTLDARNVGSDAVKIDQIGAEVPNAAHHIRLQDCEIRNSRAQGILLSAGARCNEFLGCRVHDNGATDFCHGIYITSARNLVERCMVFRNAGWGVHVYEEGALRDSAHDNTIRDSRIFDNAALGRRGVGIGLYAGDGNAAYNNVLWNNYGAIAVDYGASNTRICNNTCSGNGGKGNAGIDIGRGSSGAVVRNNIVVQPGPPINDDGSGTVRDHNLTSDPGFLDPARHDFRLTERSPAIDAGIAVSGLGADCRGVPRPQGAGWDLGAYEGAAPDSSVPRAGGISVPSSGKTRIPPDTDGR